MTADAALKPTQRPRRRCPEDLAAEARIARRLWCSVLVQAIRDMRVGYSKATELETRRARDWVGSRDFIAVCHLAGVEPGRAATALRDMMAKGIRVMDRIDARSSERRSARVDDE